jgi:hypothetical protein
VIPGCLVSTCHELGNNELCTYEECLPNPPRWLGQDIDLCSAISTCITLKEELSWIPFTTIPTFSYPSGSIIFCDSVMLYYTQLSEQHHGDVRICPNLDQFPRRNDRIVRIVAQNIKTVSPTASAVWTIGTVLGDNAIYRISRQSTEARNQELCQMAHDVGKCKKPRVIDYTRLERSNIASK